MRSGRFIGVMSGTSLDGIDVVLATITENMVAQQASLTWPIPHAIKEEILAICQGQSLTLSQLGRLDTRLGRLFADAVHRDNRSGGFSSPGYGARRAGGAAGAGFSSCAAGPPRRATYGAQYRWDR